MKQTAKWKRGHSCVGVKGEVTDCTHCLWQRVVQPGPMEQGSAAEDCGPLCQDTLPHFAGSQQVWHPLFCRAHPQVWYTSAFTPTPTPPPLLCLWEREVGGGSHFLLYCLNDFCTKYIILSNYTYTGVVSLAPHPHPTPLCVCVCVCLWVGGGSHLLLYCLSDFCYFVQNILF